MKILLIGSGGREHALAWSIADSPLTQQLVIAPGNPGMAAYGDLLILRRTISRRFATMRRRCRPIWLLSGQRCRLSWDWLTG